MTASQGSQTNTVVERVRARIVYDYDGIFTADQAAAMFDDSYERLTDTAKVTTYLPTLAERLTRERLDALAVTEGKTAKKVPEVLFVCVHNAGRSQIAAALARHYAGPALHIRTGGSRPTDRIHPEVIHAMKQIGLSMDEEFPKPLTHEVVAASDAVITMGCGDECPVVPGRRYEDWPIADPAHADADQVAAIRDDIDKRVRVLLASLLPDLKLPSTPTH